jgi:hypothetical protein
MNAGQYGKQRCLAHHWQADNGGSHIARCLQGDIHEREDVLQDAFGVLGGALAENNTGIDNHPVGKHRNDEAFYVVG